MLEKKCKECGQIFSCRGDAPELIKYCCAFDTFQCLCPTCWFKEIGKSRHDGTGVVCFGQEYYENVMSLEEL